MKHSPQGTFGGASPYSLVHDPRLHDGLSESSSDSEDSTPAYTTRNRDKNLSRGMGHHLRLPVPVVIPGLKRRHSRITSDGPIVAPGVVPLPLDSVVPPPALVPDPIPMTRVLRPRRSAHLPATSSPPATAPRVLVNQRWFYEPVPPSLPADHVTHDPLPTHPTALHAEVAAFTAELSSSSPSGLLPLVPRQSWMLDGDDRTNAQADSDWHLANRSLDSGPLAADPNPFTPTMPHLTGFHDAALSQGLLLPLVQFDTSSGFMDFPRPKALYLNSKVVRRILAARESIFKYGIYLPRNDRDADASPERARWHSGRQLEWIRLKDVKAFEYDWTKARIIREHPTYLPSEIGHLFYIYDYKFSGEHRVRLVFDGSRQSPNTYDETYSPTVRPESIRLFHVYSVEMGWEIRQFDVPQAFLQSPVDHDIFVYPPRGNVEFPGQVLKLRLALYGAKQSSALFYKLLNGFLVSLGFVSSTMDACFYRRDDALIIVHVDDMRCSGSFDTVTAIHAALHERFKITTSDASRVLGMDTRYDLNAGVLSMGMDTYIQATMDRFSNFDLTLGCPYREIVGCLLWIVLCVNGPDLVRVKDLAKRCNAPSLSDYADAMKVLKRIYKRRGVAILFKRGYAGREWVPACTRPALDASVAIAEPVLSLVSVPSIPNTSYSNGPFSQRDILDHIDTLDTELDIPEIILPTSSRFTTVAFTDASFAVGEDKDRISAYTLYVNGTPIMWGSMKQSTGGDSTCSVEFVAASVCCKQLVHLENMFRFFGFLCKKPYPLYTDSQAALSIAANANKMGKNPPYCDPLSPGPTDGFERRCPAYLLHHRRHLLTKILSGATYEHLSTRFYFLGV